MLFKNHKWSLILSSLIVLSPIGIGLLLWNRLPETIPIHWNIYGEADAFGNRITLLFLPLVLLLLHIISLIVTSCDAKKHKEQSPKVKALIFWIIPAISVLISCSVYATVLGRMKDPTKYMPIILGLIFILFGNYLPKCRQNHTFGVRLPWTLESEDNWYATHRIMGKVMVISGILLFPSILLPMPWMVIPVLLITVVSSVIPIVYSYHYHKTHPHDNDNTNNSEGR